MSDMKLRVPLCALATALLWANVSHACDSAHDAAPVGVVQEESQVMIAAEREAASLAIAAELAADAERTTGFDFSEQREASFQAIAAELAADAHRTTGFALSEWALLLDHEGESFTFLTGSELAAAALEADAFVHRFPAQDENAAAVSPEPGVSFDFDAAETTLALISAELTASIPDEAGEDADALEIGWMPTTAMANAKAELHVAIAAFISETVPSPDLAMDGLEDR